MFSTVRVRVSPATTFLLLASGALSRKVPAVLASFREMWLIVSGAVIVHDPDTALSVMAPPLAAAIVT